MPRCVMIRAFRTPIEEGDAAHRIPRAGRSRHPTPERIHPGIEARVDAGKLPGAGVPVARAAGIA